MGSIETKRKGKRISTPSKKSKKSRESVGNLSQSGSERGKQFCNHERGIFGPRESNFPRRRPSFNFSPKIFAKVPHVPFFFSAFLNKSFYSLLLLDHENEKKIFPSPPSSFKKQIRLRLRREKKDGDGKFSQFKKMPNFPSFPLKY